MSPGLLQRFLGRQQQGGRKRVIFSGNNKNFIRNGALLLKERISLFNGRTNSIRCFSVDELNSMNVYKNDPEILGLGDYGCYTNNAGVWDGKSVMVKVFLYALEPEMSTQPMDVSEIACHEVAIATQMGTHSNVHRLLGFCLHTENTVLVYQLAENGTLQDRILHYQEQSKHPLEWKARLRIAWEISHAVAYLHTAFRRPIIHRDLKPSIVFLDQHDSAKLSDFSLCISIPKGKKHVEGGPIIGTLGYIAPEYKMVGKLAESSDVFSFGRLLLVLLTGRRVACYSEPVQLVDWKGDKINGMEGPVDPAIFENGTAADELFEDQWKALAELSIRCSSVEEECRPTMVDVAKELKRIIMSSPDYGKPVELLSTSSCQSNLIFQGNDKYLIKNGQILLQAEEAISVFDDWNHMTNTIYYFSVDDLNSMNVNRDPIIEAGVHSNYAGVWEGTPVLVKIFGDDEHSSKLACHEIAIATQMGTHRNVHRLLGCCLNTNSPILVYEWPENGTLDRRLLSYNEQSEQPIDWEDRLRIAWEIAHAVAYLHTAFQRPIIHRDLNPKNVFLDQDYSARLSNFSLGISIPEGRTHVEDDVIGTIGYIAPEYVRSGKVAESSDVFGFGVLLLVLLTRKPPLIASESDFDRLVDVVSVCLAVNCLGDIVDPAIVTNGTVDEHCQHQLKATIELALRCSAEDEDCRPTMVDVATQLKKILSWSDSF